MYKIIIKTVGTSIGLIQVSVFQTCPMNCPESILKLNHTESVIRLNRQILNRVTRFKSGPC